MFGIDADDPLPVLIFIATPFVVLGLLAWAVYRLSGRSRIALVGLSILAAVVFVNLGADSPWYSRNSFGVLAAVVAVAFGVPILLAARETPHKRRKASTDFPTERFPRRNPFTGAEAEKRTAGGRDSHH